MASVSDIKELLNTANSARALAYAPYSGFTVGCALLAESGKIYTGCNIENSSYPAGICAERTALAKAVSEGERSFAMLAIAAGPANMPCGTVSPCGICRQSLAEFCKADMPIIMTNGEKYVCATLSELLPMSFSKDNL